MNVPNSKRILVLGAREAGALEVVKDLTGSAPNPGVDGSTAGLTHEWRAETAYYKANVPVWVDEIFDIQAWKSEFLKDEAKEVVEAVGAWVFCFPRRAHGKAAAEVEEVLRSIREVVDEHSGPSDAVMLAVAKPVGKQTGESRVAAHEEEQEDMCAQYGFEYIDYTAKGKNEFGEKVGFDRLREALEANVWDDVGAGDEVDRDDWDFTTDDLGDLATEEAEMTAEWFGMQAALHECDESAMAADGFTSAAQAIQVDELEKLMSKLVAVKEQSVGLSEEDRKKKAAKAVRDIMGEVTGGRG